MRDSDGEKDFHSIWCSENSWWRFKYICVKLRKTQAETLDFLMDMYENAENPSPYSPHIAGERRY
jgi:hypothetical protein